MHRVGKLLKRAYGNVRFKRLPRYRKATRKEVTEANKDETLAQATKRIGESYYGRCYSELTPEQKRYARQKARDFRRNLMVRD